jgi:hypothetical protein
MRPENFSPFVIPVADITPSWRMRPPTMAYTRSIIRLDYITSSLKMDVCSGSLTPCSLKTKTISTATITAFSQQASIRMILRSAAAITSREKAASGADSLLAVCWRCHGTFDR